MAFWACSHSCFLALQNDPAASNHCQYVIFTFHLKCNIERDLKFLVICTHTHIDVGTQELLFPWQHSTATAVHSFIVCVPTLQESNKLGGGDEISSEYIVQLTM